MLLISTQTNEIRCISRPNTGLDVNYGRFLVDSDLIVSTIVAKRLCLSARFPPTQAEWGRQSTIYLGKKQNLGPRP